MNKYLMKKKVVNWLVWLINKVDKSHIMISQHILEESLIIDYKKYIIDDGQWHFISMALGSWVMYPKQVKDRKETIYIDGAMLLEGKVAPSCPNTMTDTAFDSWGKICNCKNPSPPEAYYYCPLCKGAVVLTAKPNDK